MTDTLTEADYQWIDIMTDIINKPSHYQLLEGVEVMDITKAVLDKIEKSDMQMSLNAAGWLQQTLQYLLRCYDKGKWQDLEKAKRTLEYVLKERIYEDRNTW